MRRLSGFGFVTDSDSYTFEPESLEELAEVFRFATENGRKIVLRGAGKSYGDAAILAEEIAIDLCKLNSCQIDAESGIATVGCGATIGDLWQASLPLGFWPPVVPGTMFPTIGGVLAMNIHGKNAFSVGTLGEHVQEMTVLFADCSIRKLSPKDDEFHVIISSAGLLACIFEAKIKLKKVNSGILDVSAVVCKSWDEQFAAFEANQANADYMVSWVNAFGAEANSGRGLFHSAKHCKEARPDLLEVDNQVLPSRILGLIPKSQVWKFLKKLNSQRGIRFLNKAKFLASKTSKRHEFRQSLVAFSFLLDYVPGWEKSYSPGGFIQFQCFVPDASARELFPRLIQMQQQAGLTNFLTVMKRHRSDSFLLSHGVDGFSLAMDFKVTSSNWKSLQELCWAMNDAVLDAGGKFYLAKDSTLRTQDIERWLGTEKLSEFRKWKKLLDPNLLFDSCLARRTKLFGEV